MRSSTLLAQWFAERPDAWLHLCDREPDVHCLEWFSGPRRLVVATLGLDGPVTGGAVVAELARLEQLTLRSVCLDHAAVLPALTRLRLFDVTG